MEISNVILSDESLAVVQDGAWIDGLFGLESDVRLKMRGMQSDEARNAIIVKYAKLREENKGKPLTNEQTTQAYLEVLAEVCLIDWDGFTKDGKPFPHDKDLALAWITSKDRKNSRFTNAAITGVNRIDNNSTDFVEQVSKN